MNGRPLSQSCARARFAPDSGATDQQLREAAEVLAQSDCKTERTLARNWLERSKDEAPE